MNDERPLAIVSGAARGIGRACVEIFVAQGWQVGALDQDETVRTVFAQNERAIPLVADVTDPIALQAELDRLPSPAAAVINAAGVFPPTSLSDFQIEQYRQVFDVNVLGTLLLSQLVSRSMTDGGLIVNLSSINAFVPRPDQLLYAATKAAIVSLTRSMAADLAPRRIRVNAVAPGPVDTEGVRALGGRLEEAAGQVPLGRVASPSEIADLIFWLVEGRGAQFVTGETVVCSGGLFMR
ncbi:MULTISPECIES: SDR family oxidoreductase [unclassified Rhizobium]|uniref:SDR family NAD(P)-dependent oxidoreductase n=1 Tax=unclassified Rhizobium TaxID=2613769 RepID=UPI000DDF7307|nr:MULTISPECIES: SDR family oxidoreductase [unclassified Rhizobium]MBB3289428.1 3-oxoacyl-[acyl-carrier protein] reductase [Rhizobium sp. BK252]MBB3404370.1 3-oxoacyl-[acyl-carrier protein] reductase [Rhizobium sp. BK289]MBB3416756.1 3-oxoacyl-[acyl-carrier protein] reductase [Rhizobium sp. BK284]MBB3484633.1 3-oxoacyl-[acyl-carrier protein] reductase [Rhizobium sp. BK347]MDK4722925.1 SDR family NAD(P)-dependent oxidoreductase [Rhizobium sp. CNPSo 3968]